MTEQNYLNLVRVFYSNIDRIEFVEKKYALQRDVIACYEKETSVGVVCFYDDCIHFAINNEYPYPILDFNYDKNDRD